MVGDLRAAGPRILAFSGLAGAEGFKRARWDGLDEREYGIYQGGDSAAALLWGDCLIAASAEERFNRRKHSCDFPAGAAAYCLRAGGLTAADLDCVAHSFSYGPERDFYHDLSPYYADLYDEVLSPEVNRRVAEVSLDIDLSSKYMAVPHHMAHAASAYLPSGFADALVVVSDGLGERHSGSVLAATSAGFETLRQIPAHSSLGLLYGLVTLYLGFRFADGEYKVMGLAPYGDPSRFADTILRDFVSFDDEGAYTLPILLANVTDADRETYRPAVAFLEARFGPARTPGAPITQSHADVAAALQAALQNIQMRMLRYYRRETGLRNLCLAGGVGLNCVANGAILRSRLFEGVYVQPAAGDDGTAVGAAYLAAEALGVKPKARKASLLGPAFAVADCRNALDGLDGFDVRAFENDDLLADAVAALVDEGKIVGWFQGRMEFGPRALGNRSIIADPRRSDMRARINALVKKREEFRPFAPAVTVECAHEWFEVDEIDAPAFSDMLFVAYVRPQHRDALPATTHVDGSARVQTVSAETNRRFWLLLQAFGRRTGVPVLLNTSFNVAGQPIVCTPGEAVQTFLEAGLDALAMEQLLLTPTATK